MKWMPRLGQSYWRIINNKPVKQIWLDSRQDLKVYNEGGAYKNKKLAEFVVKNSKNEG